MTSLWVPPVLARDLALESRRREAAALEAVDTHAREEWVRVFNAQLEQVVPGMFLAGCPDPAPVDLVAQGARPGLWHLIWPSYNGGPLNVQPLALNEAGEPSIGGTGGRVEPGSWVFAALARADLWNERANRERRRAQRQAQELAERRKEQERRDRDADVMEHYMAATRTQVSMNRDTPWTQNAAGRKGAKR